MRTQPSPHSVPMAGQTKEHSGEAGSQGCGPHPRWTSPCLCFADGGRLHSLSKCARGNQPEPPHPKPVPTPSTGGSRTGSSGCPGPPPGQEPDHSWGWRLSLRAQDLRAHLNRRPPRQTFHPLCQGHAPSSTWPHLHRLRMRLGAPCGLRPM